MQVIYREATEVADSLFEYFRCSLANNLLYNKQEKEQYTRLKVEYQLSPQLVYGIEHLLRLFVLLPKLMSADWFTEENYLTFSGACEVLLKYINSH